MKEKQSGSGSNLSGEKTKRWRERPWNGVVIDAGKRDVKTSHINNDHRGRGGKWSHLGWKTGRMKLLGDRVATSAEMAMKERKWDTLSEGWHRVTIEKINSRSEYCESTSRSEDIYFLSDKENRSVCILTMIHHFALVAPDSECTNQFSLSVSLTAEENDKKGNDDLNRTRQWQRVLFLIILLNDVISQITERVSNDTARSSGRARLRKAIKQK